MRRSYDGTSVTKHNYCIGFHTLISITACESSNGLKEQNITVIETRNVVLQGEPSRVSLNPYMHLFSL
jgi:hypothetical protein